MYVVRLLTVPLWQNFWNYTSQGSERWDLSVLLDVSTQARVIISNEKLQTLAHLNTIGLVGKMTACEGGNSDEYNKHEIHAKKKIK